MCVERSSILQIAFASSDVKTNKLCEGKLRAITARFDINVIIITWKIEIGLIPTLFRLIASESQAVGRFSLNTKLI
jgi:hypothetical protein